ncbi:MAG: hypothetical protein ABR576_10815 [Thermoanaerobaculia bacterium]
MRKPVEGLLYPARPGGAWRSAAALLLLIATISIESCAPMRYDAAGDSPMTTRDANPPDPVEPDLFASSVRPVLSRRCAPCHEAGGKMYARMPFDNPQTISSHSEGISRRLKGEDLDALKKWLASLPAKEKT